MRTISPNIFHCRVCSQILVASYEILVVGIGECGVALVFHNPSILNDCIPFESVAFNIESPTELRVSAQRSGSHPREEGESSSTEDSRVVFKSIRDNESPSYRWGSSTEGIQIDDHWAFHSPTVTEGVVEQLDCRQVVIQVDDNLP